MLLVEKRGHLSLEAEVKRRGNKQPAKEAQPASGSHRQMFPAGQSLRNPLRLPSRETFNFEHPLNINIDVHNSRQIKVFSLLFLSHFCLLSNSRREDIEKELMRLDEGTKQGNHATK